MDNGGCYASQFSVYVGDTVASVLQWCPDKSWKATNALSLLLKPVRLLELQRIGNRVHIGSRSQSGVVRGSQDELRVFQSCQMTPNILEPLGVSSVLPTLCCRNLQSRCQHWGWGWGHPETFHSHSDFSWWILWNFKWLAPFKNANNKTLSKPRN